MSKTIEIYSSWRIKLREKLKRLKEIRSALIVMIFAFLIAIGMFKTSYYTETRLRDVASVIFSGLLATVMIMQYHIMENQRKIMKEQSEISEAQKIILASKTYKNQLKDLLYNLYVINRARFEYEIVKKSRKNVEKDYWITLLYKLTVFLETGECEDERKITPFRSFINHPNPFTLTFGKKEGEKLAELYNWLLALFSKENQEKEESQILSKIMSRTAGLVATLEPLLESEIDLEELKRDAEDCFNKIKKMPILI